MKLSLFSLLISACIIAISSCTHTQEKRNGINTTTSYTPADTAKMDIFNFDSLSKVYLKKHPGTDSVPIRAFTVSAADLLIAMGINPDIEPQHNHIRVYLGFNMTSKNFKLYIVPVDGADAGAGTAGNDLALDSEGNAHAVPHGEPLDNLYVLDLNAPCPTLCDSLSPFFASISY